jgi:RnfABCDGE-type electron transport complex B subunit
VTAAPRDIDAIDALLPQTQCTRCGFQGCRPYAEALANDTTALNRCPPGGSALIARLSALLGRPPLTLDPECGSETPPTVAWIDAEACIGCALPAALSRRCHRWRTTVAAYGSSRRLHRLRVVSACLSGRLHSHAR